MKEISGARSRRTAVAVNYASLAALTVIFCLAEYGMWNIYYVTAALLSLAAGITSLYHAFIRTGLWRLSHSAASMLDERELGLTHEALRYSFRLISILSLLTITCMTVSVRFSFLTLTHRGHYSFGLAAMFALNYLVNILPAAIMAWKEEPVYSDEEDVQE